MIDHEARHLQHQRRSRQGHARRETLTRSVVLVLVLLALAWQLGLAAGQWLGRQLDHSPAAISHGNRPALE